MPRRRRGASVSEHIDKSLTMHQVDIFNIGLFHAFWKLLWKDGMKMSQFKNGFEDGF
jgi:hypothetical protein